MLDVANDPNWLLLRLEDFTADYPAIPHAPTLAAGPQSDAARDLRLGALAPVFIDRIVLWVDHHEVRATSAEYLAPRPQTPADDFPAPGVYRLRGRMPADAATLQWYYGLVVDPYPLTIHPADSRVQPLEMVLGNAWSRPIDLRGQFHTPTVFEASRKYVALGYRLMLAKSLEPIFFVIALVLLSVGVRPILLQLAVFAGSSIVAAGLVAYGVMPIPAGIIAPLVALSIAGLAMDNLAADHISGRRLAALVLFGAIHGMSNAAVLVGTGFPPAHSRAAFAGFSAGTAGGYATVAAVAALFVTSYRERSWYRQRVVIPASLMLAIVGLYWTVARMPLPTLHAAGQNGAPVTATRVTAVRLKENPLVTMQSSPSLGDDIDGPTVIRVPSWVEHPLGRYYMYFAHHMGAFIRLAYADAIAGPWTIYEPGILQVKDTAFFRPQPDPVENLENFYTHVASPEIHVDEAGKRLVMWFHGWWTEGAMWPVGEPAARAWARSHGYGQYTQGATSNDGLHFAVQPPITRTSYLRVFPFGGYFYAMSRLGLLLRSRDPVAAFDAGANPFRDSPFANRVRHVALLERGTTLYVFFTAIGDAPERVMMATMDLEGDWATWKISPAVELLRPSAPYECPDLPNVPSEAGDIKGPAQQLRDPDVFEENGRVFLFYSICGEQGIAGAELQF